MTQSIPPSAPNAKSKLLRDPVHDIIAFDKTCPVEQVLLALINTPEVQRLRRVRQLGLTNLVYHGAEHSRFVHSLGATAIARRMVDTLRPNGAERERLVVLAAVLCHDLGHGPFSHVFERISGSHHETITQELITTPGTGVYEVLAAHDTTLPTDVAALVSDDSSDNPLKHIVSSQLDADRFDYILRDGLATGVRIGVFDMERILSMLEERDNRICVSFRALEAVEGYLLARFHMYKQVYLHKTSRAAERMLESVIRRASDLAESGAYTFNWFPNGAMGRLVCGELNGGHDIAQLDDMDVWYALKRWVHETDSILSELAGGLVFRRLYKTIPLSDDAAKAQLRADAMEVATSLGLDPTYQVLEDSSVDTPYKPYIPGESHVNGSIQILQQDGTVRPIEQVSDVIRLLGELRYQVRRLVVPSVVAERMLGR